MDRIYNIHDINLIKIKNMDTYLTDLSIIEKDVLFDEYSNPYEYACSHDSFDFCNLALKCKNQIIITIQKINKCLELAKANLIYELNVIDQYIETYPDKILFKDKLKVLIEIEYAKHIQIIEQILVKFDKLLEKLIREIDIQHQIMIEEGHKLLQKYLEEKIYDTIIIKMKGEKLFRIIYKAYNLIKNNMYLDNTFTFFIQYLNKNTNPYDNNIDKYFFTKILCKIFDQKPEISDFNMRNHGFLCNLGGPDNIIKRYLTDRFIPNKIGSGSSEVFKMLNGEYKFEPLWCQNAIQYAILDQFCQTI